MDMRDPKYWERRERKIREMHEYRAIYPVLGITALVLAGASVASMPTSGALSGILLLVAFSLGVGSIVVFALQRASFAADIAIQKEHERFLAANLEAGDKAKRGVQMRLTDDGELESIEQEELPDEDAAPTAASGKYNNRKP